MTVSVGIEKLRVYPGSLALSMSDLCAARGHDIANIRDTMMVDERSLNVPWEDLPKKARDIILYGSGEDEIKFIYDDGLRRYETKKTIQASRAIGLCSWVGRRRGLWRSFWRWENRD